MISPLDDAREAIRRAERTDPNFAGSHYRDALRALIQHAEEMERRAAAAETRLARIEEPDRPPSGLRPTMSGQQ